MKILQKAVWNLLPSPLTCRRLYMPTLSVPGPPCLVDAPGRIRRRGEKQTASCVNYLWSNIKFSLCPPLKYHWRRGTRRGYRTLISSVQHEYKPKIISLAWGMWICLSLFSAAALTGLHANVAPVRFCCTNARETYRIFELWILLHFPTDTVCQIWWKGHAIYFSDHWEETVITSTATEEEEERYHQVIVVSCEHLDWWKSNNEMGCTGLTFSHLLLSCLYRYLISQCVRSRGAVWQRDT